MKRNKWGIAAAAVGIHISIGSVYAWSVLTKPVMEALGADLGAVQWTFSLAIVCLGMSAALLGPIVERYGPRISGWISALCFGVGMLGSALAVTWHSLGLLYLFYGIIGGIGLGIGYITPVATLLKWFPKRRGFAAGLAIMGFGFAALLAGPLMQYFVASYGLAEMFLILGTIYAVLMTASATYLALPMQEPDFSVYSHKMAITRRKMSVKESMKEPQFYMIWWIFFTNITCGIGVLSITSPMASEIIGLTPIQAATLVGTLGLVNGAGRFLWASVSDEIGRIPCYMIFFGMQVIAYICLGSVHTEWNFYLLLALIISCYGGGFAVLPALLAEYYGADILSNIHGKMLTAWAAAGVAGPWLVATIRSHTAGFTEALYIFAFLSVIALLMSFILHLRIKRKMTTVVME